MFDMILAHAGHGATSGNTLLHYLLEPTHLPLLVVGLLATVAVMRLGWRLRQEHAQKIRPRDIN